MEKHIIKHINAWLSQWNQDNKPQYNHPYRDEENFVYVLNECAGIVLIPMDDGRILFTIISEDDDNYFIDEKPYYADNYWLSNLKSCIEIAQNYLKKNATVRYFNNSDIQCGYNLPYNSEKRNQF